MSHTHLEDLRGILLSERDSGTLIPIPHDLYQTTSTLVKTLQQEVIIMDDPFSDEARLLIEKVASIRATAEELFRLRSEKIISLAQSQADGSYIEREELRSLIPAELEMFNRIVDGVRQCRSDLIEWRIGAVRTQHHVPVEIPERLSAGQTTPSGDNAYATSEPISRSTAKLISGLEDAAIPSSDHPERADETEEGWTPSDDDEDDPFPYALVRVRADMEAFMGVDGRTYELGAGDIITLPKRNAEVLVERDIVLNINPG